MGASPIGKRWKKPKSRTETPDGRRRAPEFSQDGSQIFVKPILNEVEIAYVAACVRYELGLMAVQEGRARASAFSPAHPSHYHLLVIPRGRQCMPQVREEDTDFVCQDRW